jgi:hypothetical protein
LISADGASKGWPNKPEQDEVSPAADDHGIAAAAAVAAAAAAVAAVAAAADDDDDEGVIEFFSCARSPKAETREGLGAPARITFHGLPDLTQIDTSLLELESGKASFSAVMKPYLGS